MQSCPLSILPDIEFPRGRNETVSPFFSFSMQFDAHPISLSCPSVAAYKAAYKAAYSSSCRSVETVTV